MLQKKTISIHLNSNNPLSFEKFIISIVSKTENLDSIEILVNIDKNDEDMINIIKKINNMHDGLVRYIETDLIKTFADAWKPLNLLLSKTSKSVEFITCVSDEIRFQTKNWDQIILKYLNYYEDNIFRIRCSKYRNETYKDIWECGYKPDAYAFYTRKWLDTVGEWNPCIGPDTFQECISFYLRNYGKKYNRDIIDNTIKYSGQKVSENLKLESRIERTRIYYKAFFILMSYKIQSIANNKAYNLAKIISDDANLNKNLLFKYKIYYTNFIRRFNFFYHRGSPDHFINSKFKNVIFIIWCYLSFLDKYVINIASFLYRNSYLKKIIKDEEKLKQIMKILDNNEAS